MQGSYGASLVIRALGTWAIYMGLLINLGGEARWANPIYHVADLMPGSPLTWGFIMLAGGFLVMFGSLSNTHLPLPNFTFKQPTVSSINGKFGLHLKSVTIDWSSEQIRNAGLKIMGCWLFLFGLAFIFAIFQVPDIALSSGSRDMLLCVICVIMTKVKEPKE